MTFAQLQMLVKYVTNQNGETTDVLVPLSVWQALLASLAAEEAWQVDEAEPKANILADLQASIRQGRAGETFPISELWDEADG